MKEVWINKLNGDDNFSGEKNKPMKTLELAIAKFGSDTIYNVGVGKHKISNSNLLLLNDNVEFVGPAPSFRPSQGRRSR